MFNELNENEMVIAGLGSAGLGAGKKLAQNDMGATKTRLAALSRVALLPKEVQEGLKKGNLQFVDLNTYDTVAFKGHQVKFFESSIKEEIGVTNLDGGKFEKDEWVIITGIQILHDPNAATATHPKGLLFNNVNLPAELLNGEFTMKIDGNDAIPNQSMRVFHNGVPGYQNDKPFGLYTLDNPKIIPPQKSFGINVEGTDDVSGYLKVMLIGVRIKSK